MNFKRFWKAILSGVCVTFYPQRNYFFYKLSWVTTIFPDNWPPIFGHHETAVVIHLFQTSYIPWPLLGVYFTNCPFPFQLDPWPRGGWSCIMANYCGTIHFYINTIVVELINSSGLALKRLCVGKPPTPRDLRKWQAQNIGYWLSCHLSTLCTAEVCLQLSPTFPKNNLNSLDYLIVEYQDVDTVV